MHEHVQEVIYSKMSRLTLFAIAFSLIYPLIMTALDRKVLYKHDLLKIVLLLLYSLAIAYLALLTRKPGETQINLRPFWSYKHWGNAGFRGQIIQNVLVFTPIGFMLPWSGKWRSWRCILAGLVFSISIETFQYLLCLGYCEFDDVFHNTLGTALGYVYWRLLAKRTAGKG